MVLGKCSCPRLVCRRLSTLLRWVLIIGGWLTRRSVCSCESIIINMFPKLLGIWNLGRKTALERFDQPKNFTEPMILVKFLAEICFLICVIVYTIRNLSYLYLKRFNYFSVYLNSIFTTIQSQSHYLFNFSSSLIEFENTCFSQLWVTHKEHLYAVYTSNYELFCLL